MQLHCQMFGIFKVFGISVMSYFGFIHVHSGKVKD